MDSFNKNNFTLFLLSFVITITFVYLTTPLPDVIYKYPTPETSGHLVYQKNDKSCYKYDYNVVPCTSNPKVIN